MRRNTLLKAIPSLALILGLVSCNSNDALDDAVSGNVIGNDNIVQSDAQALSLVNGSYGPLQSVSSSLSFIIETQSNKVISFEGEEDADGPLNSRFEASASTWYQRKVFGNLYLSIANSNNAIRNVLNNRNVSQSIQDAAVGKAKLLRALGYLYLVQLYGEVPVITETDSTNTRRNTIDEVYAQIVTDLKDAEQLLPETSTTPVEPTKDAADALLARAYLAWGDNPLSYDELQAIYGSRKDPVFTKDDRKLELAVEYADKVISRGHHSLLADYTHLSGRAYEAENQERILTIQHGGDAVDRQGNHQTHCGWTFPFQQFNNDAQGKPDPDSPKVDPTQNHLESADVTPYLDWAKDAPGDSVRRNWTYKTRIYNSETGKYYSYLPPLYTPILGKAVDESWDNSVNQEITLNDNDRIEMRYAEVLLIKAEALVQLGRNTEAAVPYNQLQERAYGNKSHNVSSVSFDQIKKEWEYEFGYEQKSLLNSYRWKTLISDVQKVRNYEHFDDSYAVAGKIGRDGNVVNPFFAKIHKHLVAKYNNVSGRNYRQPIPQGLTGEDLGITPQNPGY
ncbi:MAG: RagB/SusD family nutrient uptake outer membrane protein [Prevotella sp.]|nr:RagB/SusD family nutrient uptake outer membrane protein [Prevotella sp.]